MIGILFDTAATILVVCLTIIVVALTVGIIRSLWEGDL